MVTLAALLGASQVNVARSAIDGKKFIGHNGKKGKEARGADKLKFENGKLLSVARARWGFVESS